MSAGPKSLPQDAEKEIRRLTEQDEIIAHLMNGKRIFAPIDLTQPGLQILDSGTNDGLFLRHIKPCLTEPYKLLGHDISDAFFPPVAPPGTAFAIHDVTEPWPVELQGTCDLVHERFSILWTIKKARPRDVVHNLCQLVKPGGWIQLGEVDVAASTQGSAMRDAWAAVVGRFRDSPDDAGYATTLANILEEEGFENVGDERININFPAWDEDAEWGSRSANLMEENFKIVVGACKEIGVEVPHVDMEKIPQGIKEEFMKKGGTWTLVFAYAQKPTI